MKKSIAFSGSRFVSRRVIRQSGWGLILLLLSLVAANSSIAKTRTVLASLSNTDGYKRSLEERAAR